MCRVENSIVSQALSDFFFANGERAEATFATAPLNRSKALEGDLPPDRMGRHTGASRSRRTHLCMYGIVKKSQGFGSSSSLNV